MITVLLAALFGGLYSLCSWPTRSPAPPVVEVVPERFTEYEPDVYDEYEDTAFIAEWAWGHDPGDADLALPQARA